VLEMEKVCSLKAASSSAPAPAPAPSATVPLRKPSAKAASRARQSTLDRFVHPSNGVQQEREMPVPVPVESPSSGSGHPGARPGEG
jgi:hypothetical protein